MCLKAEQSREEKGKKIEEHSICGVMQMAAKHIILWVSANFRNHIAYLGDKKSSKNAYATG